MSRQVISSSGNQDGNKAPRQRGAEGSELQGWDDGNVCSNKQIINGFLLHIHIASSTWTKSGKILPLWANISHSAHPMAFYAYKTYVYGCMSASTHMCTCTHPHIRNYNLHDTSCIKWWCRNLAATTFDLLFIQWHLHPISSIGLRRLPPALFIM